MAIIGRGPPADVIVSKPGVSARHAEIKDLGDGRFHLRDLGSTNGTYVNGKKIKKATVTVNDKIKLGKTAFVLADHVHEIKKAQGGEQDDAPETGPVYYVGRDPSNEVVIHGKRISARHARISRAQGGYLLQDLGSTNGTYVNGKKIIEQIIRPGDRVSLGKQDVDLIAMLPDHQAGPGTPAAQLPRAPDRDERTGEDALATGKTMISPAPRTRLWIGLGVVALALAVVFAVLYAARVRVVHNCFQCGEVVFDQTGFFWDARELNRRAAAARYCERCGNELITITHKKVCKHCGKEYDVLTERVGRKSGKSGTIDRSGYCSEDCAFKWISVSYRCEHCGKVYDKRGKRVARESGEEDGEAVEGFCSHRCKSLHHADPKPDEAKEALEK